MMSLRFLLGLFLQHSARAHAGECLVEALEAESAAECRVEAPEAKSGLLQAKVRFASALLTSEDLVSGGNNSLDFVEDQCWPALSLEKSGEKCGGRGYLVPSVSYVDKGTKRHTTEYCAKCDWPYYGMGCQRERSDKEMVDVVLVVDSELQLSLAEELAIYQEDLAKEGLRTETLIWDLPVHWRTSSHRELRRLLQREWRDRGAQAAFLVGHFPAAKHFRSAGASRNPNAKTYVSLGYYMHFEEDFVKTEAKCRTNGGAFIWPGYKSGVKKTMNLPIGILNHLTVNQYKGYFGKLHRWREGGNRFFDVGAGTRNKPLLVYHDIHDHVDAQPEDSTFSMGSAFHFPEDLDHYRNGIKENGKAAKCKGYKNRRRVSAPGYQCTKWKNCNFTRGTRAFWPSSPGTKPSVVESDSGAKFVLVRWMTHGAPGFTACFSAKKIKGLPFAGGSMFFMHSCGSSKYTVSNLGSMVTTLKYGLNSLGTTPSGAAQRPWIFAKSLIEGKTTGEALRDWWKKRGLQDGYGQDGSVLYGDPMLRYGALIDWEAVRTGGGSGDGSNEEGLLTQEEEQEMEEFIEDGEKQENNTADEEEEEEDEVEFDSGLGM